MTDKSREYDVCAWKVAPGVIWIQTRDWQIAATLARRKDARLVVRGVSGGFLKTFEFEGKTLTWATDSLIPRLLGISERFFEPADSRARDDSQTVSA